MPSHLRRIPVHPLFYQAIGRDVNFHDPDQTAYLDLESGDVLWIYDHDEDAEVQGWIPPEDNAARRRLVEGAPERFVVIPGLGHGDHHDILVEFLESAWTDDEARRSWAKSAYRKRSIGGWMEDVGDAGAIRAYEDYLERVVDARANEFLRRHGVVSAG